MPNAKLFGVKSKATPYKGTLCMYGNTLRCVRQLDKNLFTHVN